MKKVFGLFLFFLCYLVAGKLYAQQPTLYDTLREIVVTAQFAPQAERNAVYHVKRISSKTIEMKAATNLRELLQQELNIDLNQKSVFGTSVEMQGVSKENIKILIDGVPVIGRLNGTIDLSQINLANVERVEIIEGPVSVFYGTDAMGGVINLITKKAQNQRWNGMLSAYTESINATDIKGDIGYKFSNNVLRTGAGVYHFKGLSTTDAPRNKNWEERFQKFANLMYLKSVHRSIFRFNSSLSHEKLISKGEPNRRGAVVDKDYFTQRWDNVLSFQGILSGDHFIDANLSYLDYRRYHDTYDVDPSSEARVLSNNDTKEDNIVTYHYTGGKVQLGKNRISEKWNYAAGADLSEETATGGRILNKKQTIKTLAAFASINYKVFKDVEIQPAVRYTWNDAYGSLWSPAFNAKFFFNKHHSVRVAYARGFRAPSIKELYLDFHISAGPVSYAISGNPELDVEKSHSFNLYYSYEQLFGNGVHLRIEPSVFYNTIDNLIALSPLVDFKRHYINIDVFRSLGGKMEVVVRPTDALQIKGGFSMTGRYNKFKEQYKTNTMLYSPELYSDVQYELQSVGLSFNMFYKYTGARQGFYIEKGTDELIKTTTPSYNNMDFSVSKSFFDQRLSLVAGVKNIFDVTDLETLNQIGEAHARDMQLWGRSYFLKSILNF